MQTSPGLRDTTDSLVSVCDFAPALPSLAMSDCKWRLLSVAVVCAVDARHACDNRWWLSVLPTFHLLTGNSDEHVTFDPEIVLCQVPCRTRPSLAWVFILPSAPRCCPWPGAPLLHRYSLRDGQTRHPKRFSLLGQAS